MLKPIRSCYLEYIQMSAHPQPKSAPITARQFSSQSGNFSCLRHCFRSARVSCSPSSIVDSPPSSLFTASFTIPSLFISGALPLRARGSIQIGFEPCTGHRRAAYRNAQWGSMMLKMLPPSDSPSPSSTFDGLSSGFPHRPRSTIHRSKTKYSFLQTY